MKWRWPILVLLLAAVIYAISMGRPGSALQIGERRDWSLITLDGRTITATDSSASESSRVSGGGGVTVIEFWATWCPPCVAQVPHLKQLYSQYRDRGVRMISVSVDQEIEVQRRFIAEYGMDWTHVNDYQQPESLAAAWGVTGIPHALIFSPTGELLWEGHPARMDQPLAEAVARYAEQ